MLDERANQPTQYLGDRDVVFFRNQVKTIVIAPTDSEVKVPLDAHDPSMCITPCNVNTVSLASPPGPCLHSVYAAAGTLSIKKHG
jgi:hypothetical protein